MHASNIRKFNTYRAMDELEKSLPVTAIPIISEDGMSRVQERVADAQSALYKEIGLELTSAPLVEDEALLRALESAAGEKLIDIEELL